MELVLYSYVYLTTFSYLKGPNRDELMKDAVLDVLAELLLVPGELQGEAAGALRNLTLDGLLFQLLLLSFSDVHLDKFANTKAIDNLITIMGTLNVGPRVTCILNSIRNLSLKGFIYFVRYRTYCLDENHDRIAANGLGISTLIHKLKTTQDSSDQRYVLETLSNLSKNENMKTLLTQQNLEDILLPFLASTNEPLLNATQTILNNLSASLFKFIP
jgi:hypothetical protein